MDNEWITPKIDWSIKYNSKKEYMGDFFGIDDWKRIVNNIKFLKNLALELYKPFNLTDVGAKKLYTDFPYADEWNSIEQNIKSLIDNTFHFKDYEAYEYFDNLPTPDFNDLNKIEGTILEIYNMFVAQQKYLPTLSFTLGGYDL